MASTRANARSIQGQPNEAELGIHSGLYPTENTILGIRKSGLQRLANLSSARLGIGLALMLFLRLFEAPLFKDSRPLTQWITPLVCRSVLGVLGLRIIRHGKPDSRADVSVANHSTWLDVFVLNAARKLYFVSKSEVAGWPGIGWLAKATGTLFIKRDRQEAAAQVQIFADKIAAGQHLLFFPEGTSTDGRRVLQFKPTLFQAFAKQDIAVQPVSVRYHAPPNVDARFYGWWGDMSFGPSMLQMLCAMQQGHVVVTYHPSINAKEMDRKLLAKTLEAEVRSGFEG